MTRYSDQDYWKRVVVGARGCPWIPEQCMNGSIFQIRERHKGRLMLFQMKAWMKYVRLINNKIVDDGRVKTLKKTPTLERILYRKSGRLFENMVTFLSGHSGKYSGTMRRDGYQNRRDLAGFRKYVYFDAGDKYLLLLNRKSNGQRIMTAEMIIVEIERLDKLVSLMKTAWIESGSVKWQSKQGGIIRTEPVGEV